jgi:lipid II:glycine glycyltransferase (peptidoglycan interpeptide bridge formation enzyme)
MDNLRQANRRSYMQFGRFPILFSECRARNCGEILAAVQPDGVPVAMTFLVWDDQKMYYLMSTRDVSVRDNGSANLLVWSAMKRAHERGLLFDLDGVSTEGMARFLSGFGGVIKTRLIITKGQPVYNIVQSVKTILRGGRSAQSTFT